MHKEGNELGIIYTLMYGCYQYNTIQNPFIAIGYIWVTTDI